MNVFSQLKITLNAVFSVFLILLFIMAAKADDCYRLWLRYERLAEQKAAAYRSQIKSLFISGNSPNVESIRDELETGLNGLLGQKYVGQNSSSYYARWF